MKSFNIYISPIIGFKKNKCIRICDVDLFVRFTKKNVID